MSSPKISRAGREITKGATTADKILLIALIIISVSGFIFIKKAFPEGTDVKIEVNGKPAYLLPLNVDKTVSVKGINGDTIVEIKDRKVRINESPCPNKICMHDGWIQQGALICLPNRVIVTVTGNKDRDNRKIDAISG